MKNVKKKVMSMILAAMTVVGASAFAAAPSYNYSGNGDYTAVVISDVPQSTVADRGVGYSENGDYQAARA